MLDFFPRPGRVGVVKYGKASRFRHYQNHYLREYCRDLPCERVLNTGATPNASDKQGSTYEAYFPKAEFHTTDIAPHSDPRHFQDDLMAVKSIPGPYDLVLVMSVLEHVDRPWIAAPEITSLIKPGGYMYLAMPYFYPVHEGEGFGDHWRWTPSAMKFLFPDLVQKKCDLYPSSLVVVRDRKTYWRDPKNTFVGFSMLLQRAS
ncbi:class I SAM-dependent methyltransferase [Neorhizobium petrolearium]|uniref:class I SAM-dependent methyltransferase n=1 Tax=Neorhizobium petrolearium TaxID=515361 RepID=UPI003F19016E